MKRAVIIGGGLGGLTTSIYLAHAGWDVKILEKNKTLGGKLQQVNKDGFHFDLVPVPLHSNISLNKYSTIQDVTAEII